MGHTYTRICALLFIITSVCLLADIWTTDNQVRTDGPMIALESAQKLPIVTGKDTTSVRLAKGDSVRILGFALLSSHQDVLVQTAKGDRGELDISQLPIRHLVIDGKHKGDTIVALTPKYVGRRVSNYTGRNAEGEDFDLASKKFVPLVEGWEALNLTNNASTSVTTQKALKECKGETLEEIEKKYGMAYNILVNEDGSKLAKFRIYAYGPDGKIYTPTIVFNPADKATAFSFTLKTGKADNSWLLGNPVAGMAINLPFVRTLTRSDSYAIPSKTGDSTPWYIYVVFVFAIVALLAWFLFTPSCLVLLMGWLLEYPPVFKPLSNAALKYTIITVSILSTFIWMIALMAWGLYWFATILVIPVSYYCCRWAIEYLNLYVPHRRCPGCKRIETIELDRSEVTGSKYVKGADIKRDRLLDTKDEHYQSWTQVTTTYTNGSTTSHRENVRDHKRRHDLYRYIDFEVTYLVTFYLNHFICRKCKYHETNTSTTHEEVDRKIVGSHTGVESHDVY